MLNEVQARHSDELRVLRSQLRDRRAAIPEIEASRKRLAQNFGVHIRHLEGVGRYALSAYRDANRLARPSSKPAPSRFDQEWTLGDISVDDPIALVNEPNEDWQGANDALEQSMAMLQTAFRDCVAWIDRLAGGSNGKAPASSKEEML
jgi:hypothetical protein